MEIMDTNGVFINHAKILTSKNGKEFATFSIAYTEKVNTNKYKTSFVDGIASFKNIINKIKNAQSEDRFIFVGILKHQTWDDNGTTKSKHVVEIHKLTKVEKEYVDPYADPSSPLLQDDIHETKTSATPASMADDSDLAF